MERTILAALATYRLTKLVIDDELLSELRQAAFDALYQLPDSKLKFKLLYLLDCPWCVSMWAALSLFVLHKTSPKVYDLFATTLGMSAVTGLVYERLG